MNARIITAQAPGGERMRLAEIVPLKTPLLVQFHPIAACNFACKYCSYSFDQNKRPFISDKVAMDFNLYKKGIDELALFPEKIKALKLAGLGEPFLHPHVSTMIAYASSKAVARRTEIITNGILLTPAVSDALIAAGLSRLVVSIQGTTAEKYLEVCNRKIDFAGFVKNLKYFYDHKANTQIHIKIIDVALDGEEDKQQFYNIFGDICDTIGIEYAIPIYPNLPFNDVLESKDRQLTQYGLPFNNDTICPMPFYLLHVIPDGRVIPCCASEYPRFVGDLNNQTLVEIWNSKQFQDFRRTMLNGYATACDVCRRCNLIKYRMFPEDSLDQVKDRLKIIYDRMRA